MNIEKGISVEIFLRGLVILLLVAVIGAIIWWFREVIVYILISAVLAIIGRPLVRQICRVHIKQFRIPRWFAAALTLAIMWLFIGGALSAIIPLVGKKVVEITTIDPRLALNGIEEPLSKLQNYISNTFLISDVDFSISEMISEMFDTTVRDFLNLDTVNSVVASIFNTGLSIVIVVFSISFITFFFLKEDGLFTTMVSALFPEKYSENVTHAIDKVSSLLSRYFTGLLLESFVIAVIITVVLLLFGMTTANACFIGVIMGALNVIPYAGPAVGLLVSLFVGIISPIEGCTIAYTLSVIVCTILAVKALDDLVLQPYIYSSKVQAHPLEIFIVILMGGFAGGSIGLLVAVPSYTVFRVFAKEFFSEVSLVRKLTKKI